MRSSTSARGFDRRPSGCGRLIDAAADLLPTHDEHASAPWWLLTADAGYLWRYTPHHLHQASRLDELPNLTCDLRWVEANPTIRIAGHRRG